MSDLISRSAVLNELIEAKSQVSKLRTDNAEIINETLDIFANTINKQPTIDAVTVVRCKDCIHSAEFEGYLKRRFENGLNCRACRGKNGYGIAKLSLTTPDGYCDDGLRRSKDDDQP